ncbi:unnamed protein product [Medioppia subpectinata]|uniref:Uncharacterized protein n=1 Tax=Medioppia subpectinata TaxID=1979941 RepID=A0A7R9KM49_9ACAR|nr:unnamed protein product [Medioppia subpectinata]CAG2106052.1 unnamed protein product [Medioppia subpectinata]
MLTCDERAIEMTANYGLRRSNGQSIGIKFDDNLEENHFKTIIMERRLKQFEQLYEFKSSIDLPSDTGLKTIEMHEEIRERQ